MTSVDIGHEMYGWLRDLFPICRSLSGAGVRETLGYLRQIMPGLQVHEVPTGYRAFDWQVPDEWNIRDAYVARPDGTRVIDFKKHNLHVVGYSEPIDVLLDLDALQDHLYSLPDQPDAIPYVTSYYRRSWGFCLSHRDRMALGPGPYRIVIDSSLAPGTLTYADLVLPGESREEVLFSTYICHPSMANNELSGPVVVAALARWLSGAPRRLTYRFVFVPEIIGSLVYLSRHLQDMRQHTIAGWVVTCAGDERAYSLLTSRRGDTLTDRLTRHVLRYHAGAYREYDYLRPNRGSDERNYCAPGIDLPVASLMRSKYGEYPEYHTSLDDLSLVTPSGLGGTFAVLRKCVEILERRGYWKYTVLGEPRLAPRGLYPQITTPDTKLEADTKVNLILNLLSYADGTRDLLSLSERIRADALECAGVLDELQAFGLVACQQEPSKASDPA